MDSKKITKNKKKLKIESDSEDEEEQPTIKITKRNIISSNDIRGFYEIEDDKILINLCKLVKFLKEEGLKTTKKDEEEFIKQHIKGDSTTSKNIMIIEKREKNKDILFCLYITKKFFKNKKWLKIVDEFEEEDTEDNEPTYAKIC